MFGNAQRGLWLTQVWHQLREEFPSLKRLPEECLIQAAYPSSGARGRSEKIRACEVNYQWTGNPAEKVMVNIHPVYFSGRDKTECAMNVTKALAFGALKCTGGARWGASREGFEKKDDGTITATPVATKRLEKILESCGELPDGFGLAFPVRQVQRARLLKYVARTGVNKTTGEACSHPVIRAASNSLQVVCQQCSEAYKRA